MKSMYKTILIICIICSSLNLFAQIPEPEEILGFKPGSDFKLASYDAITKYFKQLSLSSGKIKSYTIGKSTEGKPLLMAVISSEENLENINTYKEIVKKLANPGNLSEKEASELSKEGKLFIMIGCSIHASEIGASQMSVQLAYELVSGDTDIMRKIRDEVIFLFIPSLNPDGLDMVIDWYNKHLNTPYEGSGMPWLYHKYAGHDINRDMYMLHLNESRALSKALYEEWIPQIFLSMHQMGSNGARLFIPPHYDPPNPNIDPIMIRETSLLGLSMAAYLDSKGNKGVLTNALFPEWYPGYEDSTPMMHNVLCLLSEAASVNIASPIFIKPGDLRGGGRGFEEYRKQINFPNPWEGGWWRLGNIVDYDLSTCLAMLKTGAVDKEKFLYNFYKMGKNAVTDGKTKPPYAYIIPEKQFDINTTAEMINRLILGGVKINRAIKEFTVDNNEYPAGTYVIYLSQPYRSYIKTLLEVQRYPEKYLYQGGPPESPYDLSGWTLPLQMGVNVVESGFEFEAETELVTKAVVKSNGNVPEADYGFLLDPGINDTYCVINHLLDKGCDIFRITEQFSNKDNTFVPGTFLVINKAKTKEILKELLESYPVPVSGLETRPSVTTIGLKKPKIAIYAHWGGNIDEGWTRLLLEKYNFRFTVLRNNEITTGELNSKYNVIIFPDVWNESLIIEGISSLPDRYKGGIGDKGLDNLRTFVKKGGTVIFLDTSCEFAVKYFNIPLTNVLKDVESKDFFCTGSLLKYHLDTTHPVCYGMPEISHLLFRSSPAFKIPVTDHSMDSGNRNEENVHQIENPVKSTVKALPAYYPEEKLLSSGWIVGEDRLYNRACIADVSYGSGKLVLIGFRAQHRAQTYASFKVLFNAIFYGASIF